jgi:hypothetical protein
LKTTEVFVEQVLIGFLVLAAAALIAFPDALRELLTAAGSAGATFDKIAGSVAIVAIAYLAGIVYDRFADTLFQDLEQHHRLQHGTTNESKLRLNILEKGGAVAEYSDYLRSRLRLTRSMATLLPGLAVAWVLFETQPGAASWQEPWQTRTRWALLATYAVLFLWKLFELEPRPPKDESEKEASKVEAYRKRWREAKKSKSGKFRARVALVLSEPLTYGLGLLTALAVSAGYSGGRPHPWVLPLLTASFTVLTTWTWWRIGRTDARLLRDYGAYASRTD